MSVPGRASARLEGNKSPGHPARFGSLKQGVYPDIPGKVFGWSFAGWLGATSFKFHFGLSPLDFIITVFHVLSPGYWWPTILCGTYGSSR
jgi:hypothetical protein